MTTNSGRLENKRLTTTDGTNVTNSATQAYKHIEVPPMFTSTSNNLEYSGEDDSQKVLTGNGGGGQGNAGGVSPRWGYTAPSGSRIEVNDSTGSERIDIVHSSGAGVVIEPDGSVHLYAKSGRGTGLAAPYGDVYINAGGDISIKGASSISVDTPGDLNLNVGGTLTIRSESFKLITKNYETIVDGAATTNVTNDNSLVVGGIDRKTVAGDAREQVSGNKIGDIGSNFTQRVGGNVTSDAGGDATYSTGGKQSTSVGGDHSIATGGKSKLSSSGDNEIYGGGDVKTTAGGTNNVTAGGPVKLTGSAINASPAVDLALWSEEAVQAGQATTLAGILGPKPPVQSGSGASSGSVTGPKDAEVMDAEDIVDNLTSARKYPQYPGNGVLEGANATGYGMISGDETPQAEDVYNEYTSGNQGNINPSSSGGSFDNLSSDPINRDPNIQASEPSIDSPSQHDLGAKISKYFSLGQLIRAKHSHPIPPSQYDQVVKNHILAANNVLDPLKEAFPDIVITSAYRSNSANHATGKAIDIVVESRSMTKHAEIARFARDKLPVDQVFIERNTSGRTHVHLRVANTGAKGNPSVLTCGDPKCQSKVAGINVEWLARRAV